MRFGFVQRSEQSPIHLSRPNRRWHIAAVHTWRIPRRSAGQQKTLASILFALQPITLGTPAMKRGGPNRLATCHHLSVRLARSCVTPSCAHWRPMTVRAADMFDHFVSVSLCTCFALLHSLAAIFDRIDRAASVVLQPCCGHHGNMQYRFFVVYFFPG